MTIDLTRALAIDGWMHPDELRWLAEHAQRARRIIEVGSFQGRSTRALADHCTGVVYAVDTWHDYEGDGDCQGQLVAAKGGTWAEIQQAFTRHLADHLASGRVIPVVSTSQAALPTLTAIGQADLVFIDGDHRYEACRRDIEGYAPLVRPGGILAGHDYGHRAWPGVQRAVNEHFPAVQRCRSLWWVQR